MSRYAAYCIVGLTLMFSRCALAGDSLLADAVEHQDQARVKTLLSEKSDINAPQPDGMTALHWATWHDDAELAGILLQAGAAADAENRYGVRPLNLACTHGNAKLVDLLLAKVVDVNKSLPGGETPLMTASRTGSIQVVEALLDHGAEVNAREKEGQTAIMWAAAEGHADIVARLIEAKADFQTPLASGFTPLLFAVREGRREAAKVLLEAGADVNEAMEPKRSKAGGKSPRSGTTPLMIAVENGHFELAVQLLQAGADPNDQRSGFTVLHALTWVRKPNRGDGDDGEPPPQGSGSVTSLQFVREAVTFGADVNARLEKGPSGRGILTHRQATPLFMAADTADVPLMKLLVELGADPNILNADESTLLMAAAGLGTRAPDEEAGTEPEVLEAIRYALELGGNVNAVDKNGETAMHGAAYGNLPKAVDLLAASGADVSVWNNKNRWGWTPLLIALGYRVGNFKPSPDTVAALYRAMEASGVTPPAGPTKPDGKPPAGYQP